MSDLNTIKTIDKIIIDANVLIYVFCPLNHRKYELFISHYTDTLNNIKNANASVFVNSLIISEFINRWLRMDFQKTNFTDFKTEYRSGDRYKKTIKSILRELKKFYLNWNVQKLNDNFPNIDIISKYENFPESDFNDIIIAENAITNNCKILTQDNDFSQYGVVVIK